MKRDESILPTARCRTSCVSCTSSPSASGNLAFKQSEGDEVCQLEKVRPVRRLKDRVFDDSHGWNVLCAGPRCPFPVMGRDWIEDVHFPDRRGDFSLPPFVRDDEGVPRYAFSLVPICSAASDEIAVGNSALVMLLLTTFPNSSRNGNSLSSRRAHGPFNPVNQPIPCDHLCISDALVG